MSRPAGLHSPNSANVTTLPAGSRERFADLNAEWSRLRTRLAGVLEADVARFNEELERLGVPGVLVPAPDRLTLSDDGGGS